MTEANRRTPTAAGERAWARVRSWARWSTKEKLETLALLGGAAAAEVAVRIARLPTLTRLLGVSLENVDSDPVPSLDETPSAALDPAIVARRAAAVDRIYRVWPRGNSCLRRALLLGFYVRKAHPIMRIGVARDGDEIRAHAWIEVDGRVVGNDAGDFAPLRPPASRRA